MSTEDKETFEEWRDRQPDRTEYLRFKFGIWLYKKTGYITHFVRDVQDEYLSDTLGMNYGITVGLWQAKVGLCRQFNPKAHYGFWWKMKLKFRVLLRRYKI